MTNSFYSKEELAGLGFKHVGENTKISRFAHFYDISEIEIGDNSRIDDFCILSGKIKIGNYVHVSAYCAFYGRLGIEIDSFSGTSPRTTIFSAMDDFSGDYLIGPTIPHEYTKVTGGPVLIKSYTQLGSGCVVFPDITIGEGVAVGSLSLVNKNLDEWSVYVGVPAKFIKPRSKKLLDFDILRKL